MSSSRRVTRADMAVVVGGTVLLLLTLGAVGPTGRERAKRAVCLSNLKQLSRGWRLYATDNDGKIVNGTTWAGRYVTGAQPPEALQTAEIEGGALWPYVGESKLYRCPSGYSSEMLNYAIVDSMNGRVWNSIAYSNGSVRLGATVLWVRKLNEIVTPSPAERMVLIDEGRITPDSFTVYYDQEAWWDGPPVRHDDGATVSFADGHTEYWQWQGAETVEYGRQRNLGHYATSLRPQTVEGKEDLHRLQRAVWGRLGYDPAP